MIFLVPLLILISATQCSSETVLEKPGGFCLITIMERKLTQEPYTYTKKENRLAQCGNWRTCRKEVIVQKTDLRVVFRDVPKHRLECCSGYTKHTIHLDTFHCQPNCFPECINGHCLAPGNCTCSYGFKHLTSSECGPSCTPECLNGACVAPNTCTCLDGYTKVNSSYCEPHCPDSCVDGVCVRPNECRCNAGFRIHPTHHFICEPICEEECVNANCINVNECECLDGYKKDLSHECLHPELASTEDCKYNICTPYCNLECIYGNCSAPDVCTCEEGYHLGNDSWNNCLPDCNCTNGYCSEPNECICFDNYTMNEDGECEPLCDDCINSTCTSPNVCECLDGFMEFNSTACIPECSDCDNGICTEPEVCTCFHGYHKVDFSCEPICEIGCINGICTAPNNCSCEFESERILENVCFPLCRSNCSSCNSSDTSCLTTKQTQVEISQQLDEAVIKLLLAVNCSTLEQLNSSCDDLESGVPNNCSDISIECSAVRSKSFQFLCYWKDTNTSIDSIFEETILPASLSLPFRSNMKEIKTTVLLPDYLNSGDGSCETCFYASNMSSIQGNRIIFHMLPCPSIKTESFEAQHQDSSLTFIIFGVVATSVILLAVITIIIFYQRKLHEYIVMTDFSGHNEMSEEVMLHEEINN